MPLRDPEPSEPRAESDQQPPEELARRAQAGSAESFAALVEQYGEPLFTFLKLFCGNASEAEDLAQESFVRAWRRLHLYDSNRRFSTWLFTLAKRVAVSRWRRARPRAGDLSLDAPDFAHQPPVSTESTGFDPERLALGRDEGHNLWVVAERVLTPDQRSALWLLYVEQLPTEEVARILDKRPSTVRVLVFRARKRLAEELPAYRDPAGSTRKTPAESAPPPADPLSWTRSRLAEGHR